MTEDPMIWLILGEQPDWLRVCGLSPPELQGGTVSELHLDTAGQRVSQMWGKESCRVPDLKELDFSWEMISLKLFWFYFCSKLTFNESNNSHLLSSLVDQLSAVTFQLLKRPPPHWWYHVDEATGNWGLLQFCISATKIENALSFAEK